MTTGLFIHSDLLIDREALSGCLPDATAQAMAGALGGEVRVWADAYRRVRADWASYWADLDLSGDGSVWQWREGRWRVVRGWCRLAGVTPPPVEQMGVYLDDLPLEIGRGCAAVSHDVMGMLQTMIEKGPLVIVAPYLPSSLVRGMVERVEGVQVVGPDQIRQVGLDGLVGAQLVAVVEGVSGQAVFVGPQPVPGMEYVRPPRDVTGLRELIKG